MVEMLDFVVVVGKFEVVVGKVFVVVFDVVIVVNYVFVGCFLFWEVCSGCDYSFVFFGVGM